MYKPISIYMYMFFYIDVHKPVLLLPKFTTRENSCSRPPSSPGPDETEELKSKMCKMCAKRNMAMVKPNCCHRGLNLRI